MKKIFFLDIDGTILDSSRGLVKITDKTKYAIKELAKDNYVFIASGRCMAMLNEQVKNLGANGYILCNGAYAEVNGKEIFKASFTDEQLEKIKKVSVENNGFYILEALHKIYVNDRENVPFKTFTSRWASDLDYLRTDDGEKRDYHIAMIGFNDRETLDNVYDDLKDYAGLDRHFWFTSYDVNVKGVNKGVGCLKAMEYLGIDLNSSYAFGDGLNDLQMLQTVGHPVIMKNAMKELKEYGFEMTEDVLDDGVYEYLLKNKLIKAIDYNDGNLIK